MPVSSRSIKTPMLERPDIRLFCSGLLGKIRSWACGQIQPKRDGPQDQARQELPDHRRRLAQALQ